MTERSRPPAWRPPPAIEPLVPGEEFLRAAAELGVAFEEGEVERLGVFLALLLDANATINLTAITDPREAWTRHILDSLTLLPLLAELPDNARIADVGSGGGAPALPLAIVLPRARFTLIEATGKKAAFLRDAAGALGLSNVEVIADRAETLGQDHRAHRAMYDAVTARALGRLAVVAELAAPLLKVGGVGLFIKGAQAEEELKEAEAALKALALSWLGTHQTPTGRVVVLEKTAPTPRLYPRRPGEPARSPLR
jgi:16S rRNA (guanine527-N7)-methyltransferase